ncbi:MAG: hypothetical protein M1813_003112 [Trichoglossum hirsutum]|nr:MAG: hypothetical protein M1813_003112 [Trichoglossum hirsutum]
MASPSSPPFPSHAHPRVWLITSASSPLPIRLTRHVLGHGDFVAAGVHGHVLEHDNNQSRAFRELQGDMEQAGYGHRLKVIKLDVRNMGECQSAVAEATEAFGKIDILVNCGSQAVVGTVEELSTNPGTLALTREQFETNFYGPLNIIKTVLPGFRERRAGHILVVTGIASYMGTPGLGIYCASSCALEGFCDSLAYEVAPFNIRITIIQPNMEVVVLTNKITFVPPLPQYSELSSPGSNLRSLLVKAASQDHWRGEDGGGGESSSTQSTGLGQHPSPAEIVSISPSLPSSANDALLEETIHALTAVAGHENPPAHHIVGHDGVASVKEKLKIVTQELEEFVEVSSAVDIFKNEDAVATGKQ